MTHPGLETRIVTSHDVATILEVVGRDRLMDETIAGLTAALARFDPARIRARDGFVVGASNRGILEWMPILGERDALLKLVSYSPENPSALGLPTIIATLSLFDVETGHLVALTDGVVATAVRTGAASAVASRLLASPGSSTVGLVGCGAQAVTQLHGLSRVFRIERVLVHDVDPDVARSFLDRAAFLGLDVRVAPLSELERQADIVCTATSVAIGQGPVIAGDRLPPHIHVNAVGSDLVGKTELPAALLARSLVCPDYLPQAVREGECQQLAPEQIGPALTDLVRFPAMAEPWQQRATVFDSTGFALEDKVAVEILLGHAGRLGIGTSLPIEYLARDPRDPYSHLEHRAAGRHVA